MPIAMLLPLVDGAFAFLTRIIPQIREWKLKGEISAADQQRIHEQYQALRKQADGQFTGPEWEVTA